MKYPKETQPYIDLLDEYEINDELDSFDCFHIYPKELCVQGDDINGFVDSRFFDVIGFSFIRHQKKNLGRHDELDFLPYTLYKPPEISRIRIYADGSTFIRFTKPVSFLSYQSAIIYEK